ncbi:fibronectin type III domain-containing protein [Catenulispora yoronensis]
MSTSAQSRPGSGRRWSLKGLSSLALALGTGAVAVGLVSGPAGPAHAAGGAPTFVQQAWARAGGVSTLTVKPTAAIATGDRLVVEVGVWSAGAATAASVTDTAGNTYTELTHFAASDGTELSVWTAPVTSGGGTIPTLTAKPTGSADVGVAVLEYSGVSSVGGASVLDGQSHATGKTTAAGTVAAGATAATTAPGELALGFYADSGFGNALTAGSGFTSRVNVSHVSDMELAAEEQLTGAAGATPSATFGTGASTIWLAATVVLKAAGTGAATAPGAPIGVAAAAGNGSATVTWTAPADGGSTITSYTVTPYADGVAGTPTVVTGAPAAAGATLTGLTNAVPYTFTVSAANAIGAGPVSQPSNTVVPDPVPNGQFGALQTWPIVAVHSAVLNDGKVLVWDGWQSPQPTHVYDPATQTFTTATPTDSLFCSGLAKLPDGRVLVAGGYGASANGMLGIVDTNIFDPATNAWTRMANMHYARWYPDLTELSDGRYVAISGNTSDANTWADTPEVYDPASNTWTLLSAISTPQVHEEEYPFSYLAPNGKIFTIGPEEDTSYWLDANAQTWTSVGPSGLKNGSSVMYRPGKILYSGGSASVINTTNSVTSAATIDLTATTPAWQPVAPMNYPRVYHTLTTLADGRVLAVGGEATSDQQIVTTGTLPSEIWDPATNQWTTIGSIAAARNYHSTAVLLPDGTVLIAGGGHPTGVADAGQYNAQVYSPSYLFNGPRPTITTGPGSAIYGGSMTVTTPDAASISAVNLVSYGTDTHQSDMDQHFVPLSFTAGSGTLSVQAPANGAVAPPGDYMLFIVNKAGVPSVAANVHISAAPPSVPGAPTAVTATPGASSASVAWTAPATNGAPITSYTVTPYANGGALAPTVVTGNPPATSTVVSGLTNGTSYTFTVAATNSAGTGAASTPSNAVIPTNVSSPVFVQQSSLHKGSGTTAAVALGTPVTVGNRLVVEVGVWNTSSATATGVTDSAGNTYTELTHFTASDHTEMSVWSAPITAGGGTRPTVTATLSSSADVGVAALEYSGLSTAAGLAAVDAQSHASGTTSASATVSAGATAAVAAAGELAVGFYADSGFGDTLTAGSGFNQRVNVSGASDMEFVVEDQVPASGATPAATFGTGKSTVWLAATVVFKHS